MKHDKPRGFLPPVGGKGFKITRVKPGVPRSLPCPVCNAGVGDPCRASHGGVTSVTHKARQRIVAREQARMREEQSDGVH